MKAEIKRKVCIRCPACHEGLHDVDHIQIGGLFGPWDCGECGIPITGRRTDDETFDIEVGARRSSPSLVLLKLSPQDKPVYFVVEGMALNPESDDSVAQNRIDEYYYEEQSCPTNWLHPILVCHDGDQDPHGLIEHIRTIIDQKVVHQVIERDWDPGHQDWSEVFPEIKED